ncbi:ankyrin repeat-containing protein [Penicillium vulpinum]|nr:ankyrin repeat-containing protein [Penicillium vulpinum]KAJ5950795.1 ankyrin repeat-containing protein [Penicillium vulpinum]
MCKELVQLTPLSESNLQTLFLGLLEVLDDASVYFQIYAPQIHKACAEELLAHVQNISRALSASVKIAFILEDDPPGGDPTFSNEPLSPENEAWFQTLRADIDKLIVCRLLQDRPQWYMHEWSLIQAISKVPTVYLLSLARMGWEGIPESLGRSTMASLTNTLPTSLESWVDASLKTIEPQDGHWLQATLGWVVYAARPLCPTELAVAVALDGFGEAEAFETLSDRTTCDIIGDTCKAIGPWIQITDDDQIFADEACRSMIAQRLCPSFSHEALLSNCLVYLELVLPQLGKNLTYESTDPRLGLLHYATLYWPQHC